MYYMGYMFPRFSPMVHLFDDVIFWLKDCGIVEQLIERNSPYRSMESQVIIGDIVAHMIDEHSFYLELSIWN